MAKIQYQNCVPVSFTPSDTIFMCKLVEFCFSAFEPLDESSLLFFDSYFAYTSMSINDSFDSSC